MKKSVYSLVLMDSVVEMIDQLAYASNTSRSNLINQILAEYVSYTTPEKRIKDIFERVERLMSGIDTFQPQHQPSDAMISYRSALQYRYNPTVRYCIELYRNAQPVIGALRVTFRTQSQRLLADIDGFFSLWIALERRLNPGRSVPFSVEEGRFTREFSLREDGSQWPDSQELARALSSYIRLFDQCLKMYFSHPEQPNETVRRMEQLYRAYRDAASPVL